MPLHANAEAGGRTLDRFDDAVGGGCRDREALRHMLDRLMVTAVDGTGVALVEGLFHDVPETRSLRDPDVVCDRVPGLADTMIERPGDLRRDVLNERAPARHVEDLNPPADREDGEIGVERAAHEGELVLVPLDRRLLDGRVLLLAIAHGIDVAAAREHESVDVLRDVLG